MQQRNVEPLLVPSLRAALSCLYGLPSPYESQTIDQQQANAFLIQFQSRNVRRMIESVRMSQTSLAQQHPHELLEDDDDEDEEAYNDNKYSEASICNSNGMNNNNFVPSKDMYGSTWLACVYLLLGCSSTFNVHPVERLFAAQTLLHRTRKFDTAEAVDVEFEYSNDQSMLLLYQQPQHSYSALHEWLTTYRHLRMCAVLFPNGLGSIHEAWKSQLSLYAMSAAAILTAPYQNNNDNNNTHSILTALGGAISLTAVRLKYNTKVIAQDDNLPPLITIITTSMQTIVSSATSVLKDSASSSENEFDSCRAALVSSLCASLAELPDALLGSVGGARGKLSLNPKCIYAAADEIRHPPTGVDLLKDIFTGISSTHHGSVLHTIQKWACFVPFTISFVEFFLPLVLPHLLMTNKSNNTNIHSLWSTTATDCTKAAYSLLIAIFEGACLTEDQIIALSVGLSKSNTNTNSSNSTTTTKLKGKAKKRREKKINSLITEESTSFASQECRQRKEIACQVAIQILPILKEAVFQSLTEAATTPNDMIDGEASIATLCAAASSVLPYLLKVNANSHHEVKQQHLSEIVLSMLDVLKCVCENQNKHVRRLAHDSIRFIHVALMEVYDNPRPVTTLAVDGVFRCLMALASSCSYPKGYFHNLAQNSDEDLENERNDVRDILRFATNIEQSVNAASLEILNNLITACLRAVEMSADAIPPEIAVHALSALAKPINILASNSVLQQDSSQNTIVIVQNAFQTLCITCEKLLRHLPHSSIDITLPVSRLTALAIAALSPAFSEICILRKTDRVQIPAISTLIELTEKTINLAIHQAIMALLMIPELVTISTLGESQYDIRGAMRAPGGEDHCACIALMRLSSESESLCQLMWQVYSDPISSTQDVGSVALLSDLCFVHNELLKMELTRGQNVFHGVGVLPKSRRILLNVTFQIGLNSMTSEGINHDLVNNALSGIVHATLNNLSYSSPSPSTEVEIHRLCEAAYDFGAFPLSITRTVFFSDAAVHALRNAVSECVAGYKIHPIDHPNPRYVEWGRLRGGLVSLFRSCLGPGAAPAIPMCIGVLIIAECESAMFAIGDFSKSVFVEGVIGDNMIPAGAFIKVLGEFLESALDAIKSKRYSASEVSVLYMDIFVTLHKTLQYVSDIVTLRQPEKVSDPRPFIFEAWCLSMRNLSCLRRHLVQCENVADTFEALASQSICIIVQLILLKRLRRKVNASDDNEGMSLDGPHALAMLEFLEDALEPSLVNTAGKIFADSLHIDFRAAYSGPIVEGLYVGGAIIAAAFLRMVSGALPPWALENIPGLFCSLFAACNKDKVTFCSIMGFAVDVRLVKGFGGIDSGCKIAGPFMETLSDFSKAQLLRQAEESADRNDAEGWRRMKVMVKQLCGGKKKATGFSLKPSYSSWECDRL